MFDIWLARNNQFTCLADQKIYEICFETICAFFEKDTMSIVTAKIYILLLDNGRLNKVVTNNRILYSRLFRKWWNRNCAICWKFWESLHCSAKFKYRFKSHKIWFYGHFMVQFGNHSELFGNYCVSVIQMLEQLLISYWGMREN